MVDVKLLLCVVVVLYLTESAFGFRRVCFYDSWAATRTGQSTFTPDMIDPFLCTHVIFTPAIVRRTKWELYRRKIYDLENFKRLANLTLINPDLKTLVMLGEDTIGDLEAMASDTSNRTTFISSIIPFLKQHNFNGFVLQWHGTSDNFKLMSTELRQSFDADNSGLILGADLMGPTLDHFNNNYDLNTIKETVENYDLLTVRTYSLFDAADDTVTRHHSRLLPRNGATGNGVFLTIKGIADYLSFLGIPKSKMDIGIATYGRGYTLADTLAYGYGSPVTGPAPQTNGSALVGYRSYYEICSALDDGTGAMYYEDGETYYVNGDLWVGYDDITSIEVKANWIVEEGYGGASIYGVAFDDFNQNCNSSQQPFPLINTVKDVFEEALNNEYRRVCYFTTWSENRPGAGRFTTDEIDDSLCTHLIVAFAELSEDCELQASAENDTLIYQSVNALKTNNPDLKVLLSVGGWTQGSSMFSYMAKGPKRRRAFANSTIPFLQKYGFDGLDLAWQYPTQRKGSDPADKKNFGILVDLLRRHFDTEDRKLMLTAAVSAEQENIDYAYDVKALSENLDFISIMTFDMHGYWEWDTTAHHSQLKAFPWETGTEGNLNMVWSGKYWQMIGVDKKKINIGIATYGRGFELSYYGYNTIGSYYDEPNSPGPFTDEEGFLAYYEICDKIYKDNGTAVRQSGVPYYTNDTFWIGYDDEISVANKMQWLVKEGYGGAMVWSMDLDDFRQTCGSSLSKYPLLTTIKEFLTGYVDDDSFTTKVTAATTTWESTTMSSTTTPGPHIDCSQKPVNGPYPNPRNDRNFYKCSHGEAYLYWCPADLVFNATMSVCDWPSMP